MNIDFEDIKDIRERERECVCEREGETAVMRKSVSERENA